MGSPYAERGAITDEALAVMKALWTQEVPSFAGNTTASRACPSRPNRCKSPTFPY